MDARTEIGQRIARQRRRRGLSQVVVAGLVGRSESWLSQVERGRRSIDSHAVLRRLAEVLDVDISQLTSEDTGTHMAKYEAAAAIREAMLRYDSIPAVMGSGADRDRRRPALSWLNYEIRRVNRLYQATRYEEAGRTLPGLIVRAEQACQATHGADRRTAYTLRALAYHSAATTLRRVGEPDLALMAAERSVAAAQAADRPLLAAVSAYRLGYVLISQRRTKNAEDLAVRTADALASAVRRPSPLVLSVRGGLSLAS